MSRGQKCGQGRGSSCQTDSQRFFAKASCHKKVTYSDMGDESKASRVWMHHPW